MGVDRISGTDFETQLQCDVNIATKNYLPHFTTLTYFLPYTERQKREIRSFFRHTSDSNETKIQNLCTNYRYNNDNNNKFTQIFTSTFLFFFFPTILRNLNKFTRVLLVPLKDYFFFFLFLLSLQILYRTKIFGEINLRTRNEKEVYVIQSISLSKRFLI